MDYIAIQHARSLHPKSADYESILTPRQHSHDSATNSAAGGNKAFNNKGRKPRVDLSIISPTTLQFTDGRPDRGNAKEIFLAMIHGSYSGNAKNKIRIALTSYFNFKTNR